MEGAHAFPAVGDHVEFSARYGSEQVVYEKSIKFQEPENGRFGVRILIRMGERILRDEVLMIPGGFLYTPEKIQHVLSTCVQREGALGTLRIQGRDVSTCEFYHEDSQLTTILGRVPFGQIRFQEYLGAGEFLDFWLQHFTVSE